MPHLSLPLFAVLSNFNDRIFVCGVGAVWVCVYVYVHGEGNKEEVVRSKFLKLSLEILI